jgi:hypothetical protein
MGSSSVWSVDVQKSRSPSWGLDWTSTLTLHIDVNTARWSEEQNMFATFHNGQVYYLLYKDVEPDEELLGAATSKKKMRDLRQL